MYVSYFWRTLCYCKKCCLHCTAVITVFYVSLQILRVAFDFDGTMSRKDVQIKCAEHLYLFMLAQLVQGVSLLLQLLVFIWYTNFR